jgi:DNA-binding MarR family transcriptional regulator
MIDISLSFFAVNRCFTRVCHVIVRKTGLSQAQYEILLLLRSGEKDIGTLAMMSGVTQSAMTKNINVLSKRDLVLRYKLAKDRRVTRVRISPKGKSLMSLFENTFERAIKTLLKNVSIPEQALLTRALSSVAVVFDPASRDEMWTKGLELESNIEATTLHCRTAGEDA